MKGMKRPTHGPGPRAKGSASKPIAKSAAPKMPMHEVKSSGGKRPKAC